MAREFFWGPDLSGTLDGAGGVGGLVSVRTQGENYLPCIDMNGNVKGLMRLLTGNRYQMTARYDYDPFGNRITDTGPGVELCPFGFSTKYRDEETGMLNYTFRLYDPPRARWPSRDPIGERGGVNLYGMVGNDPVNRVDVLGLAAGPGKCEVVMYIGHHWPDHPGSEIDKLLKDLKGQKYVPPCGSGITGFGCAGTDAVANIAAQYPDNTVPIDVPHDRPVDVTELRGIVDKNWEAMKKHIRDNQCKENCCETVKLRVQCSNDVRAMLTKINEGSLCVKNDVVTCKK